MGKKDNSFETVEGIIQYRQLNKTSLDERVQEAKVELESGNTDGVAFRDILSHMHRFLMRLQDKFFIQGSDSEDVYQEGAIKLMNVIDKFDPEKGNFIPFAQQAIEKHIITCINREKAQKRLPFNNSYSLNVNITDSGNSEDAKTTFLDNLEDSSPREGFNPVDVVQRDYETFLVDEINKVLSPMETRVFYYRFIEGLSYKEIAFELHLIKMDEEGEVFPDQKSVDNAIMRSRPKIKKVLEKQGLGPKDLNYIFKKKKKNSDEDPPKKARKRIISKKAKKNED